MNPFSSRARALVPRTNTSILIFVWFLASVGTWAWLRSDPLGTGVSSAMRSALLLLYSAPIVLPVALVLRQLHREFSLSSSLGRGLALMVLGSTSWAFGNVGWFYYQTCQSWPLLGCDEGARIPFPSAADFLYLGIYPLCAAGGFYVARAFGLPVRHLIWGAVAAAPLTLAILMIGLAPTEVAGMRIGFGFLVHPEASRSQTLLTTAYMFGDVVLLVMAVMLLDRARRVTKGAFLQPLRLLVGAIGLLFAADMVFFHSLAAGSYDELGLSSMLYAATLAAMPWAIHRFTTVGYGMQSEDAITSTDPWHDAARRIVEQQARLFGGIAWELARDTPGVHLDDAGIPRLEAPHDQSLRHLACTFSGRLGPSGDRLLRTALDEVASRHPSGRELTALIGDLETLDRIETAGSWSNRLWMTPLAGGAIVGISTGIAVIAVPDGQGGPYTLGIAGFAALSAMVFGHAAARTRLGSEVRRGQLQQANASLGGLLEAFDQARADERARIAGEIHDFALQQLVSTMMYLERASTRAGTRDGGPAEAIDCAGELVTGSIAGLRRIMDGLHPSSLMHGDVGAALAELATQTSAAYSLEVEIDAPVIRELTLDQQLQVYRAVAELLSNAGKHSAASRLVIHAHRFEGRVRISARDDGVGFPLSLDLRDELPPHHGWGLQLLLEQVVREQGHMHLRSTPGTGTTIELLLPIHQGAIAA